MSIPRGYRRREQAAKERAHRRMASPEVREIRAANLERQAAIARGEVVDEVAETPATETPVTETPATETTETVTETVNEGETAAVSEAEAPEKNKGGRPAKTKA